MTKPRLLDLFCGGGGATRGYQLAGFHVTGVDIAPQPNYCGDDFHQMDALNVGLYGYQAVHASPPCQTWTAYHRSTAVAPRPNLIPAVRAMLQDWHGLYVIENVPGAPLHNPVQYCGSGLGLDVRRHRWFESNVALMAPPCAHGQQPARFTPATNRTNLRRTVEVGVWRIPLDVQQQAMGIDWMTREELSQAIPPAYTQHIGEQLLAALEMAA